MYNVFLVFMLFFVYSVLGFIVEAIGCSIYSKRIIYDRGFLIGPYLPIYGTGALIITAMLVKYKDDIFALFIMSMFLCSALEYFTSLILEKIFKLRWWDYSNHKININGRICLTNAILFGIAGVVIVELANPIVMEILKKIPTVPFYIISCICFLTILTDYVLTIIIMNGIKSNIQKLETKDATEQIKIEVNNFLRKNSFLLTRLIKSFPRMEEYNNHSFKTLKELFKNK